MANNLNEASFCNLFLLQVAETGKHIKALLNDDVKVVVAQIAECLADWYKRAQTIYLKVNLTIQRQTYGKLNNPIFDSPPIYNFISW